MVAISYNGEINILLTDSRRDLRIADVIKDEWMNSEQNEKAILKRIKRNNAERNIRIKYRNPKRAVEKCNCEKGQNESADEVIAYTPDLVHEVVNYCETVLVLPKENMPKRVLGLKYVSNMLKHDKTIPYCAIPKGGFHMPMGFPFTSLVQDVYWPKMDYETHHSDQLDAYRQYFEHRNMLPTFVATLEDIGYDVTTLNNDEDEK